MLLSGKTSIIMCHQPLSEQMIWLTQLTHWGRVTLRPGVRILGHHLFKQWTIACPVPSHYLNQCLLIFNWTTRNQFQRVLNQNTLIFVQENKLGNVISKWWPFCLVPNVLRECYIITLLLRSLLAWLTNWRHYDDNYIKHCALLSGDITSSLLNIIWFCSVANQKV